MGKFIDSVNLIIRSLRRFTSLSFILAVMILMVRLYELIITYNYYSYPPGSLVYVFVGLKYDLILYLRVCAILVLPFLLIAYFSQKTARRFFILFAVLFVLGDMLLLKYFSASRVPLGADLFGYSLDEIKHTVQSSGQLNVMPFIGMALFLAYMVRVFVKHVYYKLKPWILAVFVVLMVLSMLPLKILNQQPSKFNNEFSMFVSANKLNFFGESVVQNFLNKGKVKDQHYKFKPVVASSDENSFTYVDEEYPFLHKETTPDVLGQFFNLGDTPPNIVLIIVESLGRAYSGEGAYLGSFTPFLDSLMEESLYWENCLSTSGRTFEVLPSTLASVPFGEHGFAELGEAMPDHLSLISLLKKQAGYSSAFYYGGEAHFDNMDIFLKRQGVDKIIDGEKFGEGYEKLPANANGFTWGFGDKELFRRYISEIKSDTTPRVDALLTVAMHDPFNIPDQDKYIARFNQRMDELKLSDKTRRFNRSYEKPFSTVLYFDDALQYFIHEYRNLPSFENTIFIITGDHRMPEVPISTQLDRFHVPLVIYSPMLKGPRKFSSVITHFDITPSMVALLDGDSVISRPEVAAWIGHGLDDHQDFRSINAYPLMRNKNEILDFVDNERMLANHVIYRVYDSMDIEPVDEQAKQAELQTELDNFLMKNNYVCKNNKLIPDSLRKYTFTAK